MNPLNFADGYKIGHKQQYPQGTELVYSNWTPRGSRIKDVNHVVLFGLQYFCQKYLVQDWKKNFFDQPKQKVVSLYKRRVENYLGVGSIAYGHIEALHDLGYLPLEIKAIPEGHTVPLRCPMLTMRNTLPEFFWLTNYIETIMSSVLWMPCTSATIALQYRKILEKYANETGGDLDFVKWQGHDFSFRGMPGLEAAMMSGAAHLLSFVGTDTIPAIDFLEEYYEANSDKELIGNSVPATEHSVMCAGGQENEFGTFERLITEVYPNGIVSVVSDSWDFWQVVTDFLPKLKDKIMSRNGKLVIRPDSGDPVDILCGCPLNHPTSATNISESKGLIECLWEIFEGTINEQGYKVLDSHIGAIYGDSITLERCEEICKRLKSKGFASTNVVFGIGSYTYQYNTRDTFGFAIKATYCEINGVGKEIFKNPKTDNGLKRSLKGLIQLERRGLEYRAYDQQTWEQETQGSLRTVFLNSQLYHQDSLSVIRERIKQEVKR